MLRRMTTNQTLEAAANISRGLAMDAVAAAASGHLGLPLGAAEIGAVLYGELLRHDPFDPAWLNRDRFILSAGHGSMFLYSWLHLSGYPLTVNEIKRFRQWGSQTPGHPEFGHTPGVEATTGPLGQGVGNAVGQAIAAKMLAARFNTAEHTIFDHTIWALAGDGCMQEGVASEAAALAGHLRLDNLILIYDDNKVTLDAMASASQSEDTPRRFEAYGFEVLQLERGNDIDAVREVLSRARASRSGRPRLVVAHTLIGKGIPEVAGTQKAHGEGGAKFVAEDRKKLGLPDERYFVSPEVRTFFAERGKALAEAHAAWSATYAAWRSTNPKLAQGLDEAILHHVPVDLAAKIPPFAPDTKLATRKAGEAVLQVVAAELPSLMGASADLYGSTFNYIANGGDFTRDNSAGRNIRIGIREHGMGAVLNGIAYHGGLRPSGATFMVFADYMRGAIRLAALSRLPVIYVFTHDSVAVGEDGPTHQPVETVMGLRLIVDLDVIRPADPEETAGAWIVALERNDGPSVLALTRQNVPMLPGNADAKREGVRRGGYILVKETAPLETILLSAGSEVQLAVAAAQELGPGTRVVSLPCFERFERQPAVYRDAVLPPTCERRVSIEAGVTMGWQRWVGTRGRSIGIDRFGESAPGALVLQNLGMTKDAVVMAVRALG
jgi:transketolase